MVPDESSKSDTPEISQPGKALRKPWLLHAGLLWGLSCTLAGANHLAGTQHGVFVAIDGLLFIVALLVTCIGLADKYVIHRGRPAGLRRGLRLLACIFGVTGVLGLMCVLPALYHTGLAARAATAIEQADACANHGDYDKAIANYTEAIRLDPKNAWAYHYRGTSYYRQREHDKAIADLTKAIEIDPQLVEAYAYRGLVCNQKGEYDKAIADCTAAIRLDPKFDTAYVNRSVAYNGKGEYEKAIADCTAAIRLDPNDPPTYYLRGVFYSNKGELDEAIADFTEAIQRKPDLVAAYTERGVAYEKKGNKARAAADFAKAKELGWKPS